ncbi:MAG: NADH-quinone oxidoreductase subunit K [Planctomycetes bacterium]|nr:NADH-quinone oxidoreductase subunit K [Planctomycetota bacterium]
MVYILCLVLLLVGLFGALTQKNLIKIIVSVAIIEYAVNLFLVLVGFRIGGQAPILTSSEIPAARWASGTVDPFPQVMVLTAIVIGLGVLALMVALALRIYHRHGTYDVTEIRKLRG